MIELIIAMLVGVMVLLPLSFLMVETFKQMRETLETTNAGRDATLAMEIVRQELEMASDYRIYDTSGSVSAVGPAIVFDVPDFDGTGATKGAFVLIGNILVRYHSLPDTTADSWFLSAWPPPSTTSIITSRSVSSIEFRAVAKTGLQRWRIRVIMTVIDTESPVPDETDRQLESVVYLRNQP